MKTTLTYSFLKRSLVLLVGPALLGVNSFAQTDGKARLEATILDYNGSSSKHYTVVWVTTAGGTFIKSLRKQGPGWTSSEWGSHCSAWNTARAGSTSLDGYSSATATSYSGTNSPILLTWDGRDASNRLMPDGNYRFWIQYAENSGQGPYTTSGLLWSKGNSGATNSYPNQGANFANMKVAWIPTLPPAPPLPPVIAEFHLEGEQMVITGVGPTNAAFSVWVADESGPSAHWTSIATNSCDGGGAFCFTNAISLNVSARFYRLKLE